MEDFKLFWSILSVLPNVSFDEIKITRGRRTVLQLSLTEYWIKILQKLSCNIIILVSRIYSEMDTNKETPM